MKFITEKFSYKNLRSPKVPKPIDPTTLTPGINIYRRAPSTSSMDVNTSEDQDSNPAQDAENTLNDADFDSIPAQPDPPMVLSQQSIQDKEDKSTVIMPSILKKKTPILTKEPTQLIVPQIIKQQNKEAAIPKPPIILPQIKKMDRNRISKTQVATPQIIVPSILRTNQLSPNDSPAIDQQRRSSRLKKPPDKLRY